MTDIEVHNKKILEGLDESVVEYKDRLDGMRFGKLMVVKPYCRDKSGLKYLALCDCGKYTTPYRHVIPKTNSCGCANKSVKVGDVFGRLVVIAETKTKLSYCRSTVLECLCQCGNTVEVRALSLRQGSTKSCGCLLAEHTANMNKKHGDYNTKFYAVWSSMKGRCNNPKDARYEDYGGRGITLQDSWNDYESFKKDMFDSYQEGLMLDRIDTNFGYNRENCRWVTDQLSVWNRRRNKNNTSGRTGVQWCKNMNKWLAVISVGSKPNAKSIKLGYFDKFEDAVKARESAEMLYRGDIKDYENY